MKTNLYFFNLILIFIMNFHFSSYSFAQSEVVRDEKDVIIKIADKILANTTYSFINTENNQVINRITKSNFNINLTPTSSYTGWYYWNGVLNIAMLRLNENLNKPEYKEFVKKNYAFAFDNYQFFKEAYTNQGRWRYPFALMFYNHELDDCGAMGAGLIEAYKMDQRKDYLDYINSAADFILNGMVRLDDRTLVRPRPSRLTLWGDDLFMSISFLARMGNLTGEKKYFDDAIMLVQNFNKYLYNPYNGLYYHCWHSDTRENGVAFWGRANGWVMLAQVELLDQLPVDYPGRENLIRILQQQIVGASRYQHATGLWNQLLDKRDSYLETSVTAMFTYSIAKAVNEEWIDKRYINIALNGWEGVKSQINEDGEVNNICIGTNIQADIAYYYNRPAPLGDTHGLGPILLAGNEIIKYKSKLEK